MNPILSEVIAASRREDLLREAEAFRRAARASRKSPRTFRHRLGYRAVRAGGALLGEHRPAHTTR